MSKGKFVTAFCIEPEYKAMSRSIYKGGNLVTFLVVALFFAVPVFGQSGRTRPTPTPTPDDTVKVVTEEVKLNVLAFDEDGKFFKGVTADDLVISEDNILHQPSSVRRIPANVLIMMDTGGELRVKKNLDQTRKAARAVAAALGQSDSIAVLQYADKPEILSEWTLDRQQTIQAISNAKFGRRSAFVDAISMATDFMMKSGIDNKHIVLIADGTDSGGRASSSPRFDAFQRLLGTDITVHVISYTQMELIDIEPRTKTLSKTPPRPTLPPEVVAGLPPGVRDTAQMPKIGPTINMDRKMLKTMRDRKAALENAEEQLGKLTEATNGEMMIPISPQEMEEQSAIRVARMIDSAYVVTYTPKTPIEEGSKERVIDVTSRRAGLVVHSRRRLVAPVRDN